jgi:hypothetical protein
VADGAGKPGSPHTGLRNDSFRAYADHLENREFTAAIGEVLDEAADRRVAVMCSESLWWRCHRRLVADHVLLLAQRPVCSTSSTMVGSPRTDRRTWLASRTARSSTTAAHRRGR